MLAQGAHDVASSADHAESGLPVRRPPNDRSGSRTILEIGFKRFAPGVGYVEVPTSSRKDALAGISFYAACGNGSARAQRAAWLATAVLGPRRLPGPATLWVPPMGRLVWDRLVARWRHVVGEIDSLAVAHPGGSLDDLRFLLLAEGVPRAIAKIHPSATHLSEREAWALEKLSGSCPRSFHVPRVLGAGETEGWSYLLLTPLPPSIHRVPDGPPLTAMVGEIAVGLSGLARPASIPHHWHPMHGELAPWTLRQTAGHDLVILDWETISWGPPGADEVFYRAAASALDGRPPGPIHVREAVEFWRRRVLDGRIPERMTAGDFAERLLEALANMTAQRWS